MKKIILGRAVLLIACFSSALAVSQPVEFINTRPPTASKLPFSEAVRVGNTYYLSGQLGVKPGSLSLVEGGMEAQARQTMDNIKATLASQNLSMANIVKCTVMMADMSQWSTFNTVYMSYFEGAFPARSAFGANGLALGALLEVECMAVAPK